MLLNCNEMKKTTVLLGAGAMIPFGGPTTQELTQRLLSNSICKKEFNHIYDRTNKTGNFELLLSSLELLLDWKIANEGYDSKEANSYMLLEPFSPYNNYLIKDLWELYSEAINEIIERVKIYDCYTPPYPDRLDTLTDFLKRKKQTNSLKIYSLNYDRLIPKIAKKRGLFFYEGFKDMQYEYNLDKFNTNPHTFFNLHGSIYTSYVSGGAVKVLDNPIQLEHRYKIQGGNPGENKVFLPIIAGYSKSQRIMSEPFNFGIASFMNDCNTCNRLVIVGYSFGDPHINSVLKRFIRLDSTEIIIVDYYQGDQLPDRLKGIPYKGFGIPQAKFIDKGSMLYLDKKSLIKLYLKGFEQYIIENLQK